MAVRKLKLWIASCGEYADYRAVLISAYTKRVAQSLANKEFDYHVKHGVVVDIVEVPEPTTEKVICNC